MNAIDGLDVNATYLCNPDVILREEDENGGLLFDPDTNQVKVLNATGLFVWKHCDGSRPLAEVVAAIQQTFEGAPKDQVAGDVMDFVVLLVDDGFLSPAQARNA